MHGIVRVQFPRNLLGGLSEVGEVGLHVLERRTVVDLERAQNEARSAGGGFHTTGRGTGVDGRLGLSCRQTAVRQKFHRGSAAAGCHDELTTPGAAALFPPVHLGCIAAAPNKLHVRVGHHRRVVRKAIPDVSVHDGRAEHNGKEEEFVARDGVVRDQCPGDPFGVVRVVFQVNLHIFERRTVLDLQRIVHKARSASRLPAPGLNCSDRRLRLLLRQTAAGQQFNSGCFHDVFFIFIVCLFLFVVTMILICRRCRRCRRRCRRRRRCLSMFDVMILIK